MDATIMRLASRAGMPDTGGVAQTNLALTCIFPALAGLTVAGRFYGRRLKRMTPGLDDWLILAAMILHLAQMSMSILRMFGADPIETPEANVKIRRRQRRLRSSIETSHL